MPDILSPCIKICVIEERTQICRGCGRTIAEISGWAGYSDSERLRIMATLGERLARIRDASVNNEFIGQTRS